MLQARKLNQPRSLAGSARNGEQVGDHLRLCRTLHPTDQSRNMSDPTRKISGKHWLRCERVLYRVSHELRAGCHPGYYATRQHWIATWTALLRLNVNASGDPMAPRHCTGFPLSKAVAYRLVPHCTAAAVVTAPCVVHGPLEAVLADCAPCSLRSCTQAGR